MERDALYEGATPHPAAGGVEVAVRKAGEEARENWSVRRRFRCRMAHQIVEWLLSPRRAESSRVMQGGGASRVVNKRGGPPAHVVFQDVKSCGWREW